MASELLQVFSLNRGLLFSTLQLCSTDDLSVLKTFKTERPVNSASISPLKEHVVLGGGQEAKDVTMTAGKAGKFDAKFFHVVRLEI